jgi:dedicated sortase system histidine kinase
MSLRLQLLAFGLLTLALPWAGLRFAQEMEGALRSGLESSLQASAGTVATALENQWYAAQTMFLQSARAPGRTIYGHALPSAPPLDGVLDDWRIGAIEGLALDPAHRVSAGASGRFAYLFIEADDDELIYQSESVHGDRIVLLLESEAGPPLWLLLSTGAPGAFRAELTAPGAFERSGRSEDRVVGAWRETRTGFAVEARIPLSLIDAGLGVAIIDVDSGSGGYRVATVSSWDMSTLDVGAFVHPRDMLQQSLSQFTRSGDRFRVLDAAGWVLADTGGIDPRTDAFGGAPPSPAEAFFRYALRRDDPIYAGLGLATGRLDDPALREALEGRRAVAWFRSGPESDAIVAAAVPIRTAERVLGAVLLEQASDPILSLSNQALLRLMTTTVIVSIVAAAGLLAYASVLSFRVRRLARAAETVLGPKGEISTTLPGRAARDEIGGLARSFADLLTRLREHTDYLRTLTSKLSHELRTPLAIVSTSLDNLEHEVRDEAAQPYLSRLRDGATRLDTILVAMSAATKMEQAIAETVAEPFDLKPVVEGCASAYADVYPERRFVCRTPAGTVVLEGSSELIAQLLDKLVENAASFADEDAPIEIALERHGSRVSLSVTNRGPLLPAAMRHQLFDSLVSVRTPTGGPAHLGLGLYIVALIAQFHSARAVADNLADASGVVFRIEF